MIQVTLQFSSIQAAVAALARIDAGAIVAGNPVPFAKMADAVADPSKLVDVKRARTEAPGKPSAAPTAPSQPTAEAAPSQPGPSADAPESKTTATEPTAAAPSAPAEAFDYTVLQKAVNERVAKFGKDALLAIATKHGAATFKALDASKWAAAHADVVALG